MESSIIAATTLVVLFVAACAGRPVPDPAGASASPALTSDAPATPTTPSSAESPAPTSPTCDDWGSRNYFRSASPQDVRDCLQAGADPNGPPGLHPLPPLFIAAAETPHPAVISVLVAAGADVTARAWGGLTPLHEAAAETAHAGVVTALAEAGVDPNAPDRDGVAPLHLAAVHNRNPEVVTALAATGADPNIRGPSGNTPLHLAWSTSRSLSDGRIAVIRELLRLGTDRLALNDLGRIADPTYCGYWNTATFVRVAVPADFTRCLVEGADVRARDEGGNTVLHRVAPVDPALTALLLEAGAAVDARNGNGQTPLHMAVGGANRASVVTLLDAGAPVDAPDSHGETPLMQAVSRFKYQPETAEQLALQLLAAGANPNARDESGETPLNRAAVHVSAALAGTLLEGGADPNPPAGRGKSPLETAAWSGSPEVIRLLTAAGAEVNRRNRDDGSTPLHTAVFSAYSASASRVGALLEAGADPRLLNAAGDTPLHIAARRQGTVVASLLVNAGAELDARDAKGETPLEVARLHNAPVARKLVELGADPGAEEIAWIDKPPCGILDWVVLGNSPPESVRDCLDAGAHVGEPIWFDRTPLLFLAETGLRRERATPEKIALLLAAGAGVNSRDRGANTALHLVARGGVRARDAAAVLLEGGADVNARNSDGATPLHNAAAGGDTTLVRLLLQAGAEVGARTQRGETPLHLAVSGRGTQAVTILLEAGAEMEVRTSDRRTPLHVAIQSGRHGAAATLLDAGADPAARDGAGNLADPTACEHWGTATFFAVADIDDVASCLEAGWDPNPEPGTEDRNRPTLLHVAAAHARDPAVIATLTQAGADVHARDRFGYPTLHAAARDGTPGAVRALLEAGADPHARQRRFDGYLQPRGEETPLHAAASHPNPEVAAILLEAGADVGAPAYWGRAPLHLAAQNRNPAVAKLLLEAGANANVRDFAGATALHLAAASNPNPAVLAVLLDAGADPDAQGERSDCAHWNWSGSLTPLYDAARANRNPEITAVLLAAGADINGRGTHMHLTCGSEHPTHVSPLYMAVRYGGHPAMIEALARAGADLELTDPDGRTVLHLAAISRANIFPLLLRLGADPEARDAEGRTPMDYARENPALQPWKRVGM